MSKKARRRVNLPSRYRHKAIPNTFFEYDVKEDKGGIVPFKIVTQGYAKNNAGTYQTVESFVKYGLKGYDLQKYATKCESITISSISGIPETIKNRHYDVLISIKNAIFQQQQQRKRRKKKKKKETDIESDSDDNIDIDIDVQTTPRMSTRSQSTYTSYQCATPSTPSYEPDLDLTQPPMYDQYSYTSNTATTPPLSSISSTRATSESTNNTKSPTKAELYHLLKQQQQLNNTLIQQQQQFIDNGIIHGINVPKMKNGSDDSDDDENDNDSNYTANGSKRRRRR